MAAEYRRGTGPNALPQGAATAVNAAQPPDLAGTPMEPGADVPVMFAPENDEEELTAGGSENMKILLGPSDPAFQKTMAPRDRPGRVPRYVVRHLPTLSAAAKSPDAPPALRALYNAITRDLEQEMLRRGE